jgi:hypothetical protein
MLYDIAQRRFILELTMLARVFNVHLTYSRCVCALQQLFTHTYRLAIVLAGDTYVYSFEPSTKTCTRMCTVHTRNNALLALCALAQSPVLAGGMTTLIVPAAVGAATQRQGTVQIVVSAHIFPLQTHRH